MPGSSSISTRSRGSSFPRATCFARAASPPPSAALACRAREFRHQRAHGRLVGGEFSAFPIDFGFEDRHDCRTIVQPDIQRQATEAQDMSIFDRCDFDFGLGDELDEVRDQVRRFARERIAPRAEEIDRSQRIPARPVARARRGRLVRHHRARGYGGANLGYLAHIIAMEEISRASGSVGLSYGAHSQPVHEPDRAQRHRRAAQTLSAEARVGRARRRARDERARRGLGRGRHAAARG